MWCGRQTEAVGRRQAEVVGSVGMRRSLVFSEAGEAVASEAAKAVGSASAEGMVS